jgi:DNA-directed RNA polymerase subunit H (RpoH/RPB5)
MDAATLILLAKIATDLAVTIGMLIPKTDALSQEEKVSMLKSLQENTTKLMSSLEAMAKK